MRSYKKRAHIRLSQLREFVKAKEGLGRFKVTPREKIEDPNSKRSIRDPQRKRRDHQRNKRASTSWLLVREMARMQHRSGETCYARGLSAT